MTDPYDTVGERINQAIALIVALQVADENERLVPNIMQGSLYSVQTLLEQAQGAFEKVCHQATPGQTHKLENRASMINEAQELAGEQVAEVRNWLFRRQNECKKGSKKWRALDKQLTKLIIASGEIGTIGIVMGLLAGKSIDQIMDELDPGLLTD